MSAKTIINLNTEQAERLAQYISNLGAEAEKVINLYLQKSAIQLSVDSIEVVMPRSGRTFGGKRPHKKAAKLSDPFTSDKVNLGFRVRSKGKYSYLMFPDEALGTSIKNQPLEFMDKGLQRVLDEIIDGVENAVFEIMNKEE